VTKPQVECMVEWTDGHGESVRMHIRGAGLSERSSLARVFRSGRTGSRSPPRCGFGWPSSPPISAKGSTVWRLCVVGHSAVIPLVDPFSSSATRAARRSRSWSTMGRVSGCVRSGSRGVGSRGGHRAPHRPPRLSKLISLSFCCPGATRQRLERSHPGVGWMGTREKNLMCA
jgi:hypothetical protein